LDKFKAQIKGSLTFSMESATGRMNRLARHELMLGRYSSLKNSFKLVVAMTASDLMDAANMIFNEDRMVAVSLGPVTQKEFDLNAAA
jgi:predicted Zn-dependent peptidase